MFFVQEDGMATRVQLFRKLDKVIATRVADGGTTPPRLVRANSAFAKASLPERSIAIEFAGARSVLRSGMRVAVEA
jgi:hypothetical protein